MSKVMMLALGAFGCAATANAAPTYLDCELKQTDKMLPVDIMVDEATQQVTIALPSGYVTSKSGAFSPTEVKLVDGQNTWTINRVDLSIHRSFAFMPAEDPGERGSCKVKPAPAKRAF